MATKNKIFASSARKAKQASAARQSADKQLAAAVRRYNDKIRRDVARGILTPETAPPRLRVKELKATIPQGLTPLQRGAALHRLAQEVGKRQARDFANVTTPAGVQVPAAVYEQARAQYAKAKRKHAEEEAKRQAAEAEAPKFGGVPVQPPRAWGEGAVPGNPETAKTWEKFLERAEAAAKYLSAGEWELYRRDLIANYEKHYTGDNLQKMLDALKKISNKNLESAYRAGADFAAQSYHYESEPDVAEMLQVMKSWADIE